MSDPIHIISLGAGVQSSTMALMAAAGEITPMPVAAIFADTQGEPAAVYEWLRQLKCHLPFTVFSVTAGNLAKASLVKGIKDNGETWIRQMIPAWVKDRTGRGAPLGRKCTQDYKVAPVAQFLRTNFPDTSIKLWMGISLDEAHRMKPSRQKGIEAIWPLIDVRMNRHDCLRWLKAHGFNDVPSSSCTYCPYHSNASWRKVKAVKSEWDAVVAFERQLQEAAKGTTCKGTPYLHRSLTPIDQVDLSTEEDRGQMDMFGNECEGMCGV